MQVCDRCRKGELEDKVIAAVHITDHGEKREYGNDGGGPLITKLKRCVTPDLCDICAVELFILIKEFLIPISKIQLTQEKLEKDVSGDKITNDSEE